MLSIRSREKLVKMAPRKNVAIKDKIDKCLIKKARD